MKTKTKFILNAFISSICFTVVLFIAAGRMDYIQGWLFLFVSFVSTVMNVLSIHNNSELMNERMKSGEGVKSWDKKILGVSFLCFIATMILAGFDSGRYRWSQEFDWSVSALGVFFMITGQIIFLTARHENKFFSTVVRIQTERGHTVCDTGLYNIVRHPGYFGMIISTLGMPLVLGSRWSMIPIALSVFLLFVRTSLEDKTLIEELDGYKDYTQKMRYKLIPFIW